MLAVLLVITLKGLKKFNGEIFLYYLLLYGIGRFWIEGLRTDQLLLPVVNLPVSQLLSIVLAAVSPGADPGFAKENRPDTQRISR